MLSSTSSREPISEGPEGADALDLRFQFLSARTAEEEADILGAR